VRIHRRLNFYLRSHSNSTGLIHIPGFVYNPRPIRRRSTWDFYPRVLSNASAQDACARPLADSPTLRDFPRGLTQRSISHPYLRRTRRRLSVLFSIGLAAIVLTLLADIDTSSGERALENAGDSAGRVPGAADPRRHEQARMVTRAWIVNGNWLIGRQHTNVGAGYGNWPVPSQVPMGHYPGRAHRLESICHAEWGHALGREGGRRSSS
jgi:hypothetical protein